MSGRVKLMFAHFEESLGYLIPNVGFFGGSVARSSNEETSIASSWDGDACGKTG